MAGPEAAVATATAVALACTVYISLLSSKHERSRDKLGGCHDGDTERALNDVLERRRLADLIIGLVGVAKIERLKKKNKGMPGCWDSGICPEKCWDFHQYKPVDLQDILTEDEWRLFTTAMLEDVERKYFQVLRKKKSTPADGAAPKSPKWVVVIRGTNPMSFSDIRKDVKITLSTLHTSPVVQCLLIVVKRLVEIVRSDPEKPRLVLAGHSLGASVGMLVARKVVLDTSYKLECHLFNPPFATVFSMIYTVLSPYLETKFGKIFKKKWDVVIETIGTWLNYNLDKGKSKDEQNKEYRRLAELGWVPVLYINASDPVCEGFMPDFEKTLEKTEAGYSVGSGLLKTIVDDVYPYHLIPHETLYIAQTNRFMPLTAHKLRQWTMLDLRTTVIKVENGSVVEVAIIDVVDEHSSKNRDTC